MIKRLDGWNSINDYSINQSLQDPGNSSSFRNKTGIDADVSSYLSATANGVLKHSWYVSMLLKAKYGLAKMESGVTIVEEGNPHFRIISAGNNLYNDKQYSYLPVHMGSSDSGISQLFGTLDKNPLSLHH